MGTTNKFRSGLEKRIGEDLGDKGVTFRYESEVLAYRVNKTCKYTPDFFLPNGIVVEAKGRFTVADRNKHKLIKEQHPGVDIRFVFSNSNQRLYKGSKTTYAQWCKKWGYQYADKLIPQGWLDE